MSFSTFSQLVDAPDIARQPSFTFTQSQESTGERKAPAGGTSTFNLDPKAETYIDKSLSRDGLQKLLKKIATVLTHERTLSALKNVTLARTNRRMYKRLAEELVDEFITKHPSAAIRVMGACCIADILRIFIPENPFDDNKTLANAFNLLLLHLTGLSDRSNPELPRFVYILEVLSQVNLQALLLQCPDGDRLILNLFRLFVELAESPHAHIRVLSCMSNVATILLKDMDPDGIPPALLESILVPIAEPTLLGGQPVGAFHFCLRVVRQCEQLFSIAMGRISRLGLVLQAGPAWSKLEELVENADGRIEEPSWRSSAGSLKGDDESMDEQSNTEDEEENERAKRKPKSQTRAKKAKGSVESGKETKDSAFAIDKRNFSELTIEDIEDFVTQLLTQEGFERLNSMDMVTHLLENMLLYLPNVVTGLEVELASQLIVNQQALRLHLVRLLIHVFSGRAAYAEPEPKTDSKSKSNMTDAESARQESQEMNTASSTETQLFSPNAEMVAAKFPVLFSGFIRRFNDNDAIIRRELCQAAEDLLLVHRPNSEGLTQALNILAAQGVVSLTAGISTAGAGTSTTPAAQTQGSVSDQQPIDALSQMLLLRLQDREADVRAAAAEAICNAACLDHTIMRPPLYAELLKRLHDRKTDVRLAALNGLACFFRVHCSGSWCQGQSLPPVLRKFFLLPMQVIGSCGDGVWTMKMDQLLHRALLDAGTFNPRARALCLLGIYVTCDKDTRSVFKQDLSQKRQLQLQVRELVSVNQQLKSVKQEKEDLERRISGSTLLARGLDQATNSKARMGQVTAQFNELTGRRQELLDSLVRKLILPPALFHVGATHTALPLLGSGPQTQQTKQDSGPNEASQVTTASSSGDGSVYSGTEALIRAELERGRKLLLQVLEHPDNNLRKYLLHLCDPNISVSALTQARNALQAVMLEMEKSIGLPGFKKSTHLAGFAEPSGQASESQMSTYQRNVERFFFLPDVAARTPPLGTMIATNPAQRQPLSIGSVTASRIDATLTGRLLSRVSLAQLFCQETVSALVEGVAKNYTDNKPTLVEAGLELLLSLCETAPPALAPHIAPIGLTFLAQRAALRKAFAELNASHQQLSSQDVAAQVSRENSIHLLRNSLRIIATCDCVESAVEPSQLEVRDEEDDSLNATATTQISFNGHRSALLNRDPQSLTLAELLLLEIQVGSAEDASRAVCALRNIMFAGKTLHQSAPQQSDRFGVHTATTLAKPFVKSTLTPTTSSAPGESRAATIIDELLQRGKSVVAHPSLLEPKQLHVIQRLTIDFAHILRDVITRLPRKVIAARSSGGHSKAIYPRLRELAENMENGARALSVLGALALCFPDTFRALTSQTVASSAVQPIRAIVATARALLAPDPITGQAFSAARIDPRHHSDTASAMVTPATPRGLGKANDVASRVADLELLDLLRLHRRALRASLELSARVPGKASESAMADTDTSQLAAADAKETQQAQGKLEQSMLDARRAALTLLQNLVRGAYNSLQYEEQLESGESKSRREDVPVSSSVLERKRDLIEYGLLGVPCIIDAVRCEGYYPSNVPLLPSTHGLVDDTGDDETSPTVRPTRVAVDDVVSSSVNSDTLTSRRALVITAVEASVDMVRCGPVGACFSAFPIFPNSLKPASVSEGDGTATETHWVLAPNTRLAALALALHHPDSAVSMATVDVIARHARELPLSFAVILAYSATDPDLKMRAKRLLMGFIERQRQLVGVLRGQLQSQLNDIRSQIDRYREEEQKARDADDRADLQQRIAQRQAQAQQLSVAIAQLPYPEVFIADLIHLLSHHPDFVDDSDVSQEEAHRVYRFFSQFLRFFLECLFPHTGTVSGAGRPQMEDFDLAVNVIQAVKSSEDVTETSNIRIYKLAELAYIELRQLFIHRTWTSHHLTAPPRLPAMFVQSAKAKARTNLRWLPTSYIDYLVRQGLDLGALALATPATIQAHGTGMARSSAKDETETKSHLLKSPKKLMSPIRSMTPQQSPVKKELASHVASPRSPLGQRRTREEIAPRAEPLLSDISDMADSGYMASESYFADLTSSTLIDETSRQPRKRIAQEAENGTKVPLPVRDLPTASARAPASATKITARLKAQDKEETDVDAEPAPLEPEEKKLPRGRKQTAISTPKRKSKSVVMTDESSSSSPPSTPPRTSKGRSSTTMKTLPKLSEAALHMSSPQTPSSTIRTSRLSLPSLSAATGLTGTSPGPASRPASTPTRTSGPGPASLTPESKIRSRRSTGLSPPTQSPEPTIVASKERGGSKAKATRAAKKAAVQETAKEEVDDVYGIDAVESQEEDIGTSTSKLLLSEDTGKATGVGRGRTGTKTNRTSTGVSAQASTATRRSSRGR